MFEGQGDVKVSLERQAFEVERAWKCVQNQFWVGLWA